MQYAPRYPICNICESTLNETTSERKEELKSKIKETQSEWSKFYDEKDFDGRITY